MARLLTGEPAAASSTSGGGRAAAVLAMARAAKAAEAAEAAAPKEEGAKRKMPVVPALKLPTGGAGKAKTVPDNLNVQV